METLWADGIVCLRMLVVADGAATRPAVSNAGCEARPQRCSLLQCSFSAPVIDSRLRCQEEYGTPDDVPDTSRCS